METENKNRNTAFFFALKKIIFYFVRETLISLLFKSAVVNIRLSVNMMLNGHRNHKAY